MSEKKGKENDIIELIPPQFHRQLLIREPVHPIQFDDEIRPREMILNHVDKMKTFFLLQL